MNRWTSALIAGLVLFAGQPAQAQTLATLATGEHRSPAHIERNRYRHPVATLEWLGLEPDMTVIEIWPSGGWYAEIIAPYVADRGQYYGAVGSLGNWWWPFGQSRGEQLRARMAADPDLYGSPKFTVLGGPGATIAPPGSADAVLSFRNVHNWMHEGEAPAFFDAFYRALRPGGLLGVVEHRADSDAPQDPRAQSGYVREDYVIRLAEGAGFEFVAASEINANPADDHDHPGGVWTLPPSLTLGERDRDKYLAIGESDRMTLKFRKPK